MLNLILDLVCWIAIRLSVHASYLEPLIVSNYYALRTTHYKASYHYDYLFLGAL
jgi:hypothetical protein